MTDGSSTELCGCRCRNPKGKCGCCDESLIDEYSVDEIVEDIRQVLAALDGSRLSTISLLTGISIEKLIELGGINDDA